MSNIRKIGPLANWKLLEASQSLHMPGVRRAVKLRLISQDACSVNIYDMVNGTLVSGGTLDGLGEFHMSVDGDIQVSTTSFSDVYYNTDDGHVAAVEYDNEQFVTEMHRRPRNPEVELMMYMQQLNNERREQQMRLSMEAQAARLERLYGNGVGQANGNAGGDGGLSQSPVGDTGAGAGGGGTDAGAAGAKNAEKSSGSAGAGAQSGVSENAKVSTATVAGK